MARFPVTPSIDGETTETKMTPLIDVVFQLIIFLMCTLHFRSLDAKLETYLPAEKEMKSPLKGKTAVEIRQVRIALINNDSKPMAPAIKLDDISLAGYDELTRTLEDIQNTTKEVSVIIEPQGKIPTQCVIDAIDACKKAGVIPKLVPK